MQLDDLEIETIASIFAVLTDAQCKFFLENKELIWDIEDLDISDDQKKEV